MKNREDLKSLTAEQLNAQLVTERERLLRLKFANAVSPIENPMRIKAARKDIARILTELSVKSKEAKKN